MSPARGALNRLAALLAALTCLIFQPPAAGADPLPFPLHTTTQPIAAQGWREFEWSPRAPLFAVNTGRLIRLYDGTSLKSRIVYTAPAGHVLASLAWSPDGTRLAAAESESRTGRAGAAKRVMIFDLYANTATRLSAGPIRTSRLIWTSDGKRLLYATYKQICTLNAATGAHRLLVRAAVNSIHAAVRGPGSVIFFLSGGTNNALWIVGVDSKTATPGISAGVGGPGVENHHFVIFNNLSYRPNSMSILAVNGTLQAGGNGVYFWNASTGKFRIFAENASSPAWSPDGKWVFYGDLTTDGVDAAQIGQTEVYAVSPNGGGRVRVSVDGRRILHTSENGRPNQGIYLTTIER